MIYNCPNNCTLQGQILMNKVILIDKKILIPIECQLFALKFALFFCEALGS